jgi:stage II sporulation protein D
MKEQLKLIFAALLALVMVPLTVTLIFSGWNSISLKKEPDIDMYLGEMVYREMPEDYEEEAIKAQVVLARSTLRKGLEDGKVTQGDLEQIASNLKEDMDKAAFQKRYEIIQKCVKQTEGQVLMYDKQLCEGSFHRISAGATRNGVEVFEDDTYEYMTGVESAMDMEAKDYMKGHYMTPQVLYDALLAQYPDSGLSLDKISEQIEIVSRDTNGYILEMKVGNISCSGEEFRKVLHLNSSNFTFSQMGEEIRFLCRGLGHGLGMSQYGANKLAEKKQDYKAILKYYFPKVEIIEEKSE